MTAVTRVWSANPPKKGLKAVYEFVPEWLYEIVVRASLQGIVHWHEPAREVVRGLAGTPGYVHSQRARRKIEVMFSELKN